MAEAALRHALAARRLPADVGSAGTDARPDRPAHPLSMEAVARAGLGDLSAHRSRLASPLMVRSADLVLCMEPIHRSLLVAGTPQAAGRVRLLGHWQGAVIPDPVGGEAHEHRRCLELIDACLQQWLDRLSQSGLLR